MARIIDYDEGTRTVAVDAGGTSPVFNRETYKTNSMELSDGSTLEHRTYEGIVYCVNPVDTPYRRQLLGVRNFTLSTLMPYP